MILNCNCFCNFHPLWAHFMWVSVRFISKQSWSVHHSLQSLSLSTAIFISCLFTPKSRGKRTDGRIPTSVLHKHEIRRKAQRVIVITMYDVILDSVVCYIKKCFEQMVILFIVLVCCNGRPVYAIGAEKELKVWRDGDTEEKSNVYIEEKDGCL